MMSQTVYSVSHLTKKIKELLEMSFPRLWVEGEISNFKRHSSGHLYFTLKDENAQISCAMWRFRAGNLLFAPQSGMKVLVEGDVQVYERNGNYQLIVQQMQPAGVGALQMAFDQLKKKLHAEGLFDEAHKKALPQFPAKIGVITSPTGAALRDIISVLSRRFPGIEIILAPVRVQGETAAAEISQAIVDFNEYGAVDLLIVGRGGGSLEDLWAFNEEVVARSIFASEIPIISAVGHEVDYSIADFVADRRAPTPSAAAEIAVRSRTEVLGALQYYQEKLQTIPQKQITQQRERLANIRNSYAFRQPMDRVMQAAQRLDELQRNMENIAKYQLQLKENALKNFSKRLDALNPAAILKRGYSIVYKNGKIVRNTDRLAEDDILKIQLGEGQIDAKVIPSGDNK